LSVLTGVVFNYTHFLGGTIAVVLCYLLFRSTRRIWDAKVQHVEEMVYLSILDMCLWCASLCSSSSIAIILTFTVIPHVCLVIKKLKEPTPPSKGPLGCLLLISWCILMASAALSSSICDTSR
ncbi:hypothetical protein PMAYCL1PPCAC_20237, partial [Pristionchus mayeri]